jgi:hypothetical protein
MQVRLDCILRSEEDCQNYLGSFKTGEKDPKHRLPETITYPCVPVVYEIRAGSSYSHAFVSLAEVLSVMSPEEIVDSRPDLAAYGADRLEDAPKAHTMPKGGKSPEGIGKVQAHLSLCIARKPMEVQRHLMLWDGKESVPVPSVCVQGDFSGVGHQLQDAVNRTLLAAAEDSSSEVSHAVDDS